MCVGGQGMEEDEEERGVEWRIVKEGLAAGFGVPWLRSPTRPTLCYSSHPISFSLYASVQGQRWEFDGRGIESIQFPKKNRIY